MAVKRCGVYYEARYTTGSARLADVWETLTEAKKGIDKANERAVKRGYPSSEYLITKTEWENEFTDKGKFKNRTVRETAIQTYPKKGGV